MVTLNYDQACSNTEFEIDQRGVLTLGYKMTSKEMLAIKLKSLASGRREYFDAQYGYLDMKSIGINGVKLEAFC